MIPFQPALASGSRPVSLAQKVRPLHTPPKTLGETFDEMLGFSPMLGDLLRLAGHGLGAWIGTYVGLYGKSKMMKSVGWLIGISMGLTGICDLVSIVQRLVKPQPTTSEVSVQGPEVRARTKAIPFESARSS